MTNLRVPSPFDCDQSRSTPTMSGRCDWESFTPASVFSDSVVNWMVQGGWIPNDPHRLGLMPFDTPDSPRVNGSEPGSKSLWPITVHPSES